MDEATIQQLNAMNREFYRVTLDNFDESRGRFWAGWERVLALLKVHHLIATPLHVADLGCGNARFGRFLGKHWHSNIVYHGTDNSQELLVRAAEDLRPYANVNTHLDVWDLVEARPPAWLGQYQLVALYGVLHHIPAQARREQVMHTVAQLVAPGGFLVMTAWCFYEYERFRERLLPFPPNLQPETHDYLMDWRRGHQANSILRYCHYIDEAEQNRLVRAAGLPELERFRADGHTHDINRYSILHRPAMSHSTHES